MVHQKRYQDPIADSDDYMAYPPPLYTPPPLAYHDSFDISTVIVLICVGVVVLGIAALYSSFLIRSCLHTARVERQIHPNPDSESNIEIPSAPPVSAININTWIMNINAEPNQSCEPKPKPDLQQLVVINPNGDVMVGTMKS